MKVLNPLKQLGFTIEKMKKLGKKQIVRVMNQNNIAVAIVAVNGSSINARVGEWEDEPQLFNSMEALTHHLTQVA